MASALARRAGEDDTKYLRFNKPSPPSPAGFLSFEETTMFNWHRRCAYDAEQKREFHRHARAKLKALAKELKFAPGSFDIRSN